MTESTRPEFKVQAGKDGILHLALSGHIGAENLEGLREWAEEVKRVSAKMREEGGRKILVVTDISRLENYHPEALNILAELLKENEPNIEKSATFGGGNLIVMAQDIIAALSGRTNFKAFGNEEEALAWLRG